jgi:NADPH:quinone reductase-like Zn-dependent oxidoreductase
VLSDAAVHLLKKLRDSMTRDDKRKIDLSRADCKCSFTHCNRSAPPSLHLQAYNSDESVVKDRRLLMKPMTFRRIVVTKRGPPENLQITECELRDPKPKEVRLRVLATCVCLPDVQARYGLSPFAPRVPFTPGYASIGQIDAVGPGVVQAAVGDKVAAYLAVGGYAEYIYLREDKIIPVPLSVNPAEAVTLVLNYLVACQVMHRSAKVKAGDKVLIVGASGGCGTAFLDLGRLANLKMYGIASKNKHSILARYGATPIDYHTEDFAQVIRRAEPDGLDAIFDGVGGDYIDRAFPLLHRGGVQVEYGNPLSFRRMTRLLFKSIVLNLLPNGKTIKPYGSSSSSFHRKPFLEDWAQLFRLLQEGKIHPVISGQFPLLDAARANAILESGQVVGNLVLVSPELLKASHSMPADFSQTS